MPVDHPIFILAILGIRPLFPSLLLLVLSTLHARRAALRVAYRGAMSPAQATQADFDELYKHFDEEQVVEIVASIALFGFLNRWNDTMATEIETLPADVAVQTLGETFDWEPGKHSG